MSQRKSQNAQKRNSHPLNHDKTLLHSNIWFIQKSVTLYFSEYDLCQKDDISKSLPCINVIVCLLHSSDIHCCKLKVSSWQDKRCSCYDVFCNSAKINQHILIFILHHLLTIFTKSLYKSVPDIISLICDFFQIFCTYFFLINIS